MTFKENYDEMIENITHMVNPWRANVRAGLLYTYGLKSQVPDRQMINLYVTYDEEHGRLMLSIVKQIFSENGKLLTIACLHLTDYDLDSVPDTVTYTSEFFDGNGRFMTSLNIPADKPVEDDLEAWRGWMEILFQHINAGRSNTDMVDPDS